MGRCLRDRAGRTERIAIVTGGRASLPGMTSAPDRWWDCPLDVETLAQQSVDRTRGALARLARTRGLGTRIDTTDELIAAGFAAFDHLRVDGEPVEAWAELSGFVRAADGWVRLHGNFPHHADALRRLYGIRDRAGLEAALARRPAADVEAEVAEAGGIAVRVRDREEWERHPQALARAGHPWAEREERGGREPLTTLATTTSTGPDVLPLAGVRVLDLTRVLAGPTASQLLACLGADVLRIDPPHRPELIAQHLVTGMGKRSTVLDLRRESDLRRTRELAAMADVILSGYRPGALDALGLGPDDLVALAPHAVIALLSAWGEAGPWGSRAGFDSIVQAAAGIGAACGTAERPGALPVQALDVATGHLIAAEVLDALADARARRLRFSLLGAAEALWALPRRSGRAVAELEVPTVRVRVGERRLRVVPPVLRLDGQMIAQDVGEYGAAAPAWRD